MKNAQIINIICSQYSHSLSSSLPSLSLSPFEKGPHYVVLTVLEFFLQTKMATNSRTTNYLRLLLEAKVCLPRLIKLEVGRWPSCQNISLLSVQGHVSVAMSVIPALGKVERGAVWNLFTKWHRRNHQLQVQGDPDSKTTVKIR